MPKKKTQKVRFHKGDKRPPKMRRLTLHQKNGKTRP